MHELTIPQKLYTFISDFFLELCQNIQKCESIIKRMTSSVETFLCLTLMFYFVGYFL